MSSSSKKSRKSSKTHTKGFNEILLNFLNFTLTMHGKMKKKKEPKWVSSVNNFMDIFVAAREHESKLNAIKLKFDEFETTHHANFIAPIMVETEDSVTFNHDWIKGGITKSTGKSSNKSGKGDIPIQKHRGLILYPGDSTKFANYCIPFSEIYVDIIEFYKENEEKSKNPYPFIIYQYLKSFFEIFKYFSELEDIPAFRSNIDMLVNHIDEELEESSIPSGVTNLIDHACQMLKIDKRNINIETGKELMGKYLTSENVAAVSEFGSKIVSSFADKKPEEYADNIQEIFTSSKPAIGQVISTLSDVSGMLQRKPEDTSTAPEDQE